jgi:hypothetical protein
MYGNIGRITSEIAIALIRSKAVYQVPQAKRYGDDEPEKVFYPCTSDLYAATTRKPSMNHEFPSDSSEFLCNIVHFYALLLVLRCYEDYNLRHDTQPTNLDESERMINPGINHHYIEAMYHRRTELVKLKQNLTGFLGPLAPD